MNYSRSSWKSPLLKKNILIKIKSYKTPIIIYSRSSSITPSCVGLNFLIHNGKTYHSLLVSLDMVGHKFGEFAPTRKKNNYKKK
jgi:ribosomal protein S19